MRRRALIAAAIAAAIVVFLLWRRGDAPAGDGAAATAAPAPAATAEPELAVTADRMRREMDAYREASIYPHWSMRLTPEQNDFLAWNAAVTEDLQVEDDLVVRFDGSAGRVFPGEPYTSSLQAWRVADGARTPLPITITRAAVSILSGPDQGEAYELTYRDDGTRRYVNRFVPSEHDELSRASMTRIELYAQIDGTPRLFVRDFVFAPREVIEVVGAKDAIRDGSLVVTLDVEVLEAGLYTFYANLKSGDDTPIAMTKLTYRLDAGRRSADLVFFGKVIRDVGLDGPYRVTDIHGLKRPEGDEFDVWWSHRAPHVTAAHRAADFSPAEWDDEERREKLAHFERIIAELELEAE